MKEDFFDKQINGGSPKLLLNEKGCKMIENLSSLMCTDEEIASILGVSVDTLTNKNNKDTFTEYKLKGQNKGKSSLRRIQFKLAEKNSAMAIFLGKNYLGQKDSVEMVDNTETNRQLQNIANLINKPKKVRTEEDINE